MLVSTAETADLGPSAHQTEVASDLGTLWMHPESIDMTVEEPAAAPAVFHTIVTVGLPIFANAAGATSIVRLNPSAAKVGLDAAMLIPRSLLPLLVTLCM